MVQNLNMAIQDGAIQNRTVCDFVYLTYPLCTY